MLKAQKGILRPTEKVQIPHNLAAYAHDGSDRIDENVPVFSDYFAR